jgi:hypothetical protein
MTDQAVLSPDSPAGGLLFPAVKTPWSNVEKTSVYGPYNEALQFRVLLKLWAEPAFKADFIANPKEVLAREAKLPLADGVEVKVVEDDEDLFHFILPRTPSPDEFNFRYQQIADWWMLAHGLAVSQLRAGQAIGDIDHFRQALQVMIIGKTWFDPSFKQAMIDDAKAALEAETNATFPKSLVIKAPVDTDHLIHFAIPRHPQDESLLADSSNLAGWFAAGHAVWQFLVAGRLLRPLPIDDQDKILS